ncbi:NAD(P)-binding domain-containing protein [Paenibacillus sp. H1-7]|uniref:NAD(P)-dependent oxidoreductase n=1 Tax=Paenibacillus sp. H1-7 TaxID=2282849 RepID=UPI001EF8E8C3|nr:NAD(P)-binding domain-containing protein [Paenibacillus sp. H1-7]
MNRNDHEQSRNDRVLEEAAGIPDADRTPVTVIGLGAMGSTLAGAFLDSGHPTTVWNRTPGKADALVARGAALAATVDEAVKASSLVVICVLDYSVVQEILQPASSGLAGRVLVNLTNGTPVRARELAEWAGRHGADYLDGGIMAVPSLIARPEAVLLYSGTEDAFNRHHSTLSRLGKAVYLGSDPGLAPLHDLALLSGMYGMFGGFLHAAALVGSEGVKATEFTSTLLIPWLQAMMTTLPEMARQIDTGDYTSKEASLEMQASNDTIGEVSRAQGISTELFAPLYDLMKRRVAEGHGSDDFPSVIELIRKRH